jgi:hypothetical protein
MKAILLVGWLSLLLSWPNSAETASHTMENAWQSWPQVGKATLTWGWWTIYRSELRAPDGEYQPQQPHALVITYARDISDTRLMEATDDQWQHLGFSASQRAVWLETISPAWGDIKENDRLAFVRTRTGGTFYYQRADQNWQLTLNLTDTALADAFLAIWLSENTDYPDHRKALLGDPS